MQIKCKFIESFAPKFSTVPEYLQLGVGGLLVSETLYVQRTGFFYKKSVILPLGFGPDSVEEAYSLYEFFSTLRSGFSFFMYKDSLFTINLRFGLSSAEDRPKRRFMVKT